MGDGGLVKAGGATKHRAGLANLVSRQGSEVGRVGLEQTGRAACTYRDSCDRTHSVFLVLFCWDMDLEKQTDWAADTYELLRVK